MNALNDKHRKCLGERAVFDGRKTDHALGEIFHRKKINI